MSINFEFYICRVLKTFLRALFLFTVVWTMKQTTMRYFISKYQLDESCTKPQHHERFNKIKRISYLCLFF